MKTLLVEDNQADARLIREMLKEHTASTFEVRHVTRLDMALECLREETFDVLLLDLGLPDTQGMETLAVTHKAWGLLPIVVLTGLDDELFALEVMRAGAQDYLVKGRFDTQLLVRTIRYAVKRKQAEEEIRRLNAELEMRVAERTLQFQAANEELNKELAERKKAGEARQISIDFLAMVNQSRGTKDLLERAAAFFQQRSGCEAVGIRLREGEDYPYFEARGFSDEFVQIESRLCARSVSGEILKDSAGIAVLECLCGNVIRGCVEISKPFYTAHGSFWSNSTTELIAGAGKGDLPASARNRCNREGYESVALFPINAGEERFGLLQLVDRRKGQFSAQNIVLWEQLAGHLATAVSKFRAEEALQESEKRYRNLFNAMNEGFCIVEVLFDADGKPEDYRFLEVNDAFEQQTGLDDAVGKRMRELAPAHEAHWFQIYGKIALTGEPAHFMNEAKALNRFYDVHAYRVGEPEQRRVAIVFNDVSDYKRAEEELRRSEKLAFQRQQLQALAERLQQAREEERKMVARDLHDDLGQILTAIKMDMTWMVRHLPKSKDEVHERLEGSIELINNGVQSVRRICSGLRPGVLDDLGLAAAIEWQANEFSSRTGISVTLSLPPAELRLDGDRSTAIFRIFQECLTNVARHAEAKVVRASLCEEGEELLLEVEDDGKGFHESGGAGSLGLLGMKERAQAWGGNVQVSSCLGQGTTVTVRVPLRAANVEREDHAHPDSR